MVVCKYYRRGNCRYGQYCQFEHINNFDNVNEDEIAVMVANDLLLAERGGQWLLSCYAPFKERPCIPGMDDLSPDEVRWEIYEAQKNGIVEQAKLRFQQVYQDMKTKIEMLKNPSQERIAALKRLLGSSRNAHVGLGNNTSTANNIFANKTFGMQNNNPFGGGVFGSSTNTSSIFGKTNNSFSAATFGNTFGGFGTATNTNSIFGDTTNTSTSFNSVQNNASAFTSQNNSIFASSQSVFGQSNNVFSGTNQLGNTSSTSLFNSPMTSQANNSLFGSASTTAANLFGSSGSSNGLQSNVFGASTISSNSFSNSILSQPKLSAFGGVPVFGGVATNYTNNSMFGNQTFGTPAISTNNIFSTATTTPSFGTPSTTAPAFGAVTTTPAFGTPAAITTSTFGGLAASTTPAFGTPSTTAPAFGALVPSSTTSTFGGLVASTTPAFGATSTSAFGTPSTTASAFGAATTTLAFGTPAAITTSTFGGLATSTTPAFGTPSTTAPAFGALVPSTTPTFGVLAASTTPAFGALASSTTPTFGANTTSTSTFGVANTMSDFNLNQHSNNNTFGATVPTSSVFGGQNTNTVMPMNNNAPFGTLTTEVNSPFATANSQQFGSTSSTSTPFAGTGYGITNANTNTFGKIATSSDSIFAGAENTFVTSNTTIANPSPFNNVNTCSPFDSINATSAAATATANPFAPFQNVVQNQSDVNTASSFEQHDPNNAEFSSSDLIDDSAYSAEGTLTDDEKNKYLADYFIMGKIPLRPPTKDLCR